MTRDYSAMMNAAFELGSFTGYLTSEDEKAQSKVQQTFDAARNVFVYDILKTEITGDEAKQQVHADLDEMEQLQPEWGNIYGYVQQELYDRIDSESGKSPLLRKVVRWTPLALGVVALIVYFGIRMTSGVEVNAPFESKIGLQQRAEAVEKVITHDEWASSRSRRGGVLKDILLWPIEPSEPELKAGSEFAVVALEGYNLLSQQGQLCGVVPAGNSDGPSQEQVDFIGDIAASIQDKKLKWETPPTLTILTLIRNKFPCEKTLDDYLPPRR